MQAVSSAVIEQAILNKLQNETCQDYHPGISCNSKDVPGRPPGTPAPLQTQAHQRTVTLALVSPAKELLKLVVNFTKSILFAGGYTALVRRTVCFFCLNYKFIGSTSLPIQPAT
jgi:hypothetical protein